MQDLLFQCVPSKFPAGIIAIRPENLQLLECEPLPPLLVSVTSITNLVVSTKKVSVTFWVGKCCKISTSQSATWVHPAFFSFALYTRGFFMRSTVWWMCCVLCMASVISTNIHFCLYEILNFIGSGSDSEWYLLVEKKHKSNIHATLLRAILSGFWSLASLVLFQYD